MRIPSLPDWAFFPAMILIIAGMVVFAVMMGGDRRPLSPEQIRADGMVYENEYLQSITTGPGLSASFLGEGERSFVRISAIRGPFDGVEHGGAFFAMDARQLQAFQGHAVEITATVRRSPADGADGFRMNFFVPDRGQDHWQRFEVSEDYETFTKITRSDLCEWRMGLVSFWPDWDEGAQFVDLERVEIRAIEPVDCR